MKSKIGSKPSQGNRLKARRPARTLGELEEMMRPLLGIGAGPKRKTKMLTQDDSVKASMRTIQETRELLANPKFKRVLQMDKAGKLKFNPLSAFDS